MAYIWWHDLRTSWIVLSKVDLKAWINRSCLAQIIRRLSLIVSIMVKKRSRVLLCRVVLTLRVLDNFLRLNACSEEGRSSLLLVFIMLQWVGSLSSILAISS